MKNFRLIDVPTGIRYNLTDLLKKHGEVTIGRGQKNEIVLGKDLTATEKRERSLETVSCFQGHFFYSSEGEDACVLFKDSSSGGTGLERRDKSLFLKKTVYPLKSGDELTFGYRYLVRIEEVRNGGEFPAVEE